MTQIGTTFGDLMHNLRSALDHVVYALALLNVRRPKMTGFPIFDTEPPEGFAIATKTSLKSLGDRERALIEELQPYNRVDRGALALSLVRTFNNEDKHRTLVGLKGAVARFGSSSDLGFEVIRDLTWNGSYTATVDEPLEANAPIFELPVEATGKHPQMRMNGEPPLLVAFGNGKQLLRGEAVPATAGEIIRTVRTFEPFFRRLPLE